MKVYTDIIGNVHQSPAWQETMKQSEVEYLHLDQWTAQKSRFLAKSEKGQEYPIALGRHLKVVDGDVLAYSPEERKMVVVRLDLSPVLVISLEALAQENLEEAVRRAVELGHAVGNQHWPAVVKGMKVYVPLTVDKKVMLSVMATHHIEGLTYSFQEGRKVIPYLAPHEERRLFGGTEPN